jgi:uncharacterized Zn finger protein
MYYYACPYCVPSEKARLIKTTMPEVGCKYNKEDTCEDEHKCKEVMECKECKAAFTVTKKFLKDQKRKIKDG